MMSLVDDKGDHEATPIIEQPIVFKHITTYIYIYIHVHISTHIYILIYNNVGSSDLQRTFFLKMIREKIQ